MAEPLFDIITTIIPDRKTFRVDGHVYELATHDDFGLEERANVNRTWNRILELEQKARDGKTIVKSDNTEYDDGLRKLASILLPDCPKPTIRKMGRSAQEAVVLAFFGATDNPRMKMMAALAQESLLTGPTSSPDSNGSTGAPPESGSDSPSVS